MQKFFWTIYHLKPSYLHTIALFDVTHIVNETFHKELFIKLLKIITFCNFIFFVSENVSIKETKTKSKKPNVSP